MSKKKAPSSKPTEPKNNSKRIVTVQHREIKSGGRKFDSAFAELRIWLPLWELPLWFCPNGSPEALQALLNAVNDYLSHKQGEKPHE